MWDVFLIDHTPQLQINHPHTSNKTKHIHAHTHNDRGRLELQCEKCEMLAHRNTATCFY